MEATQTDRQTDRQTHTHVYIYIHTHMYMYTYRIYIHLLHRHRHRHSLSHTHIHAHTPLLKRASEKGDAGDMVAIAREKNKNTQEVWINIDLSLS